MTKRKATKTCKGVPKVPKMSSIKINLMLPPKNSNKKSADSKEKIELEDYFILRLPPDESKYIHKILARKPKKLKKTLQIHMDKDLKSASVFVKKKELKASMVNLPTIIECAKTMNNVNVYKTGTISKMLVCEANKFYPLDKKTGLWPHGITNPMKNVVKQRFRKTTRNHEDVKEAADIQKEVSLLLRTDFEAVSTRFEVLTIENKAEMENMEEINYKMTELFGIMSDSDSDESTTSAYDIIDYN